MPHCFRRDGVLYMNIPEDRFPRVRLEHYNLSPSSVEAKKEYFLNTDDLRGLPHVRTPSAFGCGRGSCFYLNSDLLAAAIRKYGEEGYQKKVLQREKRAQKKREREDEGNKENTDGLRQRKRSRGDSDTSVEDDSMRPVRKVLRKMMEQNLCLATGQTPGVCRVELPNITKRQYAALCGCPWDVELQGMGTEGAWYKKTVTLNELLDENDACLVKFINESRFEIKGDTAVHLSYMPAQMLLNIVASNTTSYPM